MTNKYVIFSKPSRNTCTFRVMERGRIAGEGMGGYAYGFMVDPPHVRGNGRIVGMDITDYFSDCCASLYRYGSQLLVA